MNVNISVPDKAEVERWDEEAWRRRMSRSELVREAMRRMLAGGRQEAAKE